MTDQPKETQFTLTCLRCGCEFTVYGRFGAYELPQECPACAKRRKQVAVTLPWSWWGRGKS